jgi:hypothetical protein
MFKGFFGIKFRSLEKITTSAYSIWIHWDETICGSVTLWVYMNEYAVTEENYASVFISTEVVYIRWVL